MEVNKQGFTLLEVLIALVILALAFSSAYYSLNNSTRHLISLRDKTAAEWVGLNVIANAQLARIPPSGTINGTDNMFESQWNFQLNVQSTPDVNVSQMFVTVRKSVPPYTSIQLVGYLFKNPTKVQS